MRNIRRRDWVTLDASQIQTAAEARLPARTVPELLVTQLFLSARDSVEVFYLNCVEWWPAPNRDITVGDARAALGTPFTLEVGAP